MLESKNRRIEVTNKKAFTLAEILLTLAIVGVVVAFGIPSLINNVNDAILVFTFKKKYAELSTAFNQLKQENGGDLAYAFTNDSTNTKKMLGNLVNYLNITKYCAFGASNGICWHEDSDFKSLEGNTIVNSCNSNGVVLNDGTIAVISFNDTACKFNTPNFWGPPICGSMVIDVNGFKGPNIMGKDIFMIWISKNGLHPRGGSFDSYGISNWEYGCNPKGNWDNPGVIVDSGKGCAGKILIKGSIN